MNQQVDSFNEAEAEKAAEEYAKPPRQRVNSGVRHCEERAFVMGARWKHRQLQPKQGGGSPIKCCYCLSPLNEYEKCPNCCAEKICSGRPLDFDQRDSDLRSQVEVAEIGENR
jgi:hypothetical protein